MAQPPGMPRGSSLILGLEVDLPPWVAELGGLDRPYATDEERMRLAIDLARENVLRKTGGPFGAAVFDSETATVVGIGVNGVTRLGNSVIHAEMLAIMLAQRRIGSYSLAPRSAAHYQLFSTCEPCTMCMGGICWSGITRTVFGATRQDATDIGFDEGPLIANLPIYLSERGITLEGGLLQAECRSIMDQYAGVIYNGSKLQQQFDSATET